MHFLLAGEQRGPLLETAKKLCPPGESIRAERFVVVVVVFVIDGGENESVGPRVGQEFATCGDNENLDRYAKWYERSKRT